MTSARSPLWAPACAQLRKKTRTSISPKICYVKSRFQILFAVEQFSSVFSKDKLMIRLPLACRGRTAVRSSANSSHVCCVELALKGVLCTRLGSREALRDWFFLLIHRDGYVACYS